MSVHRAFPYFTPDCATAPLLRAACPQCQTLVVETGTGPDAQGKKQALWGPTLNPTLLYAIPPHLGPSPCACNKSSDSNTK